MTNEQTLQSTRQDAAASTRPAAIDERKVIFTAEVALVTDDFSRTEAGVPALIKEHGGYVSEANVQRISGTRRSGRWVARVPVGRFDALLDRLATLGVPENRRQQAQEVTEEFIDLQSRIATQKRLEERVLKLLDVRAGNLEETIRLEHELMRIRGEAERMEGRLRYLNDRTTLATITITAREEQNYTPPEAPNFARRLTDGFDHSWTALVETGQDLAVGGARVAPWLLASSILVIPAGVFAKRRWRIWRRQGK